MFTTGPQHKSRAITYIRPEALAAAVRQQNLVLMGKGKLLRRKPIVAPPFSIVGREGSLDPKQAKLNKELGYW